MEKVIMNRIVITEETLKELVYQAAGRVPKKKHVIKISHYDLIQMVNDVEKKWSKSYGGSV